MLPKLAENPANKVLVVPTDIAGIAGLAATLTNLTDGASNGNGNGARPNAAGTTYRPTAPALPQSTQNNQ